MNMKTKTDVVVKDSENFEGYMANSNEEFKMLIMNKAMKSFAKAEAHFKPIKLDSLLSKLYLAL
jgi:hypothetical protein